MDEAEFKNGITQFYSALHQRFDKAIVGYSVKTNSLPYALAKAKEHQCFAEVVSDDEFELALECGYPVSQIIFNGPMKSKPRFLEAIQSGAIVNIETHREIEWLAELPNDKLYNVGIRVSVNISEVSPQDADGDNDFSRFGFNDSTPELANAIAAIQSLSQVRLSGIHIHRTSHSRSLRFYQSSVDYAARIIQKYQLQLDYIDLGGGYYGIFRNAPTFDDYASAIYDTLKQYNLQHLAIIVEPGNALTAAAFQYYTTVIDVKHTPTCHILTTDGSRNDLDPFYRKSSYLITTLPQAQSPHIPLQIVAGATCLEYDQICQLKDAPALQVGDIIYYNNVGAYTLTLSPMFINYFPRVYALGEEVLVLVREKWTAKEYIQKSKTQL